MTNDLPMIDAEVLAPLDTAAAQRLDTRIRLMAGQINDSVTKLSGLVEQAKRGEIHKALGFPSWTTYVVDALAPIRLDRGQRRELVGYLSGEGMSQRVIADVVGADRKTVRADLAQVGEIGPPGPADDAEDEPADISQIAALLADGDIQLADEIETAVRSNPSPVTVTGRDGKQYPVKPPQPRPEVQPSKPRRRPITDAFWRATFDLSKAVARVGRLTDDDRFTGSNRETIADTNRRGLIRARDEINRIIDQLGGDL